MTFEKKRLAARGAISILVGLIVMFGLVIVMLIWPYNLASFTGEGKIIGPKVITPGSTIIIQWDRFCANGVDLYYERWADVYDEDSDEDLLFSYGIPPFIAYHDVSGCTAPADGPLTLPNCLPPGKYRIRFTVSYHPNPIRTIYLTTQTELFTIIPKADGTTPISPK